jgi:protein TonB
MKPENILQADLLDIIFLGRNKEYGAYTLRKNYDTRLLRSFAATIVFVLSLIIGQYIKSNYFRDQISNVPPVPVHDVHLSKIQEPEKKKEIIKETKKLQKQLAQKAYVVPKIVKDDQADKSLPEVKELENKIISNTDKTGIDVSNEEVIIPANNEGKGEVQNNDQPIEVIEPTAPLVKAEVMPEFPGGMEAFKKFMLRNLRQPDLNEGEKIIVRVQFVVDADGSIKNMNILQSGGGLDNEVMRVVAKMPKWKPGIQNGRFVAVYFTLPVTFIGPDS